MQAGGYARACPELTAAEKAIVYHYTHTGSTSINRELYAASGHNNTLLGQALAAALAKLPPFTRQLVFSAAWLTQPEWQLVLNSAAGDTLFATKPLRWPAFLSASTSLLVAEQHANYSPKTCLFSIQSKTGRSIEALSALRA